MKCEARFGPTESLGNMPYGVCRKGVGSISVKCNQCSQWIHKRCCDDVSGKLQNVSDVRGALMAIVSRSCGHEGDIISLLDNLYCAEKFCYLGDWIYAAGQAGARAGVHCAWAKFRELVPVLTSRGASLKVKGQVYWACIPSVLGYESETFDVRV